MTDRRDEHQQADHRAMPVTRLRRPYAPPELVEYGTVSKLTQTGTGSVNDFGMMRMMICL